MQKYWNSMNISQIFQYKQKTEWGIIEFLYTKELEFYLHLHETVIERVMARVLSSAGRFVREFFFLRVMKGN